MSSLTDMIEEAILGLIEEADGFCEISRNAFAARLQVAPSQVTYAISTRFGHRHGYLVESRRGGAGYIRIRRIPYSEDSDYIMHLVRSVSDRLSQHDAHVLIEQLMNMELLSREMSLLMKASLSDASLQRVEIRSRDGVRSDLFRHLLTLAAALTEEDL